MHEDLKTCLSEARAHEIKISLPYPETDYDEKSMKILKKQAKEKAQAVAKTDDTAVLDDDDKVVAKKMTKQDMKKQNKLLIILLSIFTALVVVITTVVILIPRLTSSAQIKVPDVSGKTVSEAITILQDAGFVVSDEQMTQANSEVEKDHIIKTSPSAESKRKKGSEVTLYVSSGTDAIEIEDYTGKNYNEIKGKLEALGLQVFIEKKDIEDTDKQFEDNIVIDQSVKEGESLTLGDKITLYIPNLNTKYPDFTDGTYTVSDVEDWCTEMNITLKKNYVEDETKSDGTIVKQNKIAGQTKVVSGTTLTITIVSNNVTGEIGENEETDNGL